MGNNKKLDSWLMPISLLICTILTIITEYYIIVQPSWLKDIVCVLISFVFSWTFIFGLLKNIIFFIWTKTNKEYYLGGKWYVVYHEDTDFPKYIRSGTAELKQNMDEVKMHHLLMHTPSIENNVVIGFGDNSPLDVTSGHRPSTGSGVYIIDLENLLLKGFFTLYRGERNESVMGLDICTIHKADFPYVSPQHLSGNFYNAEKGREKKPTTGIIVLYKNKKEAENYIKKRFNRDMQNSFTGK